MSTEVWVCACEHQRDTGIVTSVHRSRAGANQRAAELVQVMINDSVEVGGAVEWTDKTVTEANWPEALAELQDIHGAQFVTAEVFACDLDY